MHIEMNIPAVAALLGVVTTLATVVVKFWGPKVTSPVNEEVLGIVQRIVEGMGKTWSANRDECLKGVEEVSAALDDLGKQFGFHSQGLRDLSMRTQSQFEIYNERHGEIKDKLDDIRRMVQELPDKINHKK